MDSATDTSSLEGKDCFISISIGGNIIIFRRATVLKDTDTVISFLDVKTGKLRSYNRMLVQEAYEL